MVVIDSEMPATGLGAEMDVMDQADARQFVESAVPG